MEGLFLKKQLCLNGIGLVLFDFCGCGYSEGEFVSLGLYESKDLHIIIKYLKKKF